MLPLLAGLRWSWCWIPSLFAASINLKSIKIKMSDHSNRKKIMLFTHLMLIFSRKIMNSSALHEVSSKHYLFHPKTNRTTITDEFRQVFHSHHSFKTNLPFDFDIMNADDFPELPIPLHLSGRIKRIKSIKKISRSCLTWWNLWLLNLFYFILYECVVTKIQI